ncbi:hypothetical protein [Novosphingobium sp. Gsoil 351]|uniref:hypothetical protein n=1 Tax=Novosphingobium sp. Gsoil 351 TaxID=2675225 RepID=UPI00351ADDDE
MPQASQYGWVALCHCARRRHQSCGPSPFSTRQQDCGGRGGEGSSRPERPPPHNR